MLTLRALNRSLGRYVLGLLGFIIVAASGSHAATVTTTFGAATDVPITASGYTATGNELAITLNFDPPVGTNLTVVKNTALPFISGTFTNVPNGSTVNLTHNGTTYPFIAWYYGGTGNDLVLLWPTTGLTAWGHNPAGQLGDASIKQRNTPVIVDQSGVLSGKTIVHVARGSGFTLALTNDGQVYSWGYNSYGQLGDGTTTTRTTPIAVNTNLGSSALAGKFVVAIAAGDVHSLALCSDGTLVGWGDNSFGRLGDGTTSTRTNPVPVVTMEGASALYGKSVVALSAGSQFSLALCSDGTVVSWGNNANGQLGDGTTTTRTTPVAVSTTAGSSALSGKSVFDISAGADHGLALCSDGTLVSWGANASGQLGDTTSNPRNAPVAVNTVSGSSTLFGRTVVAISGGSGHSLALCSDGTVSAWGWNSNGQLGDGSTTSRTTPVLVNTANGASALHGKSVTAITAGYVHSIALCSDGSLTSWGTNVYGQLGDGTLSGRTTPVAVTFPDVLTGHAVSAFAQGCTASHSTALYSATKPVIAVEVLEPSPTALVHGASTADIGTGFSGERIKTFRISNVANGSLPIQGLHLDLSGTDASAFTLLRPLPTFLPAGQTTDIRVALTGPTSGAKNAVLNITTAGDAVSPFTFGLVGNVQTELSTTFTSPTDGTAILAAPHVTDASLHVTLGFEPEPGTNLTIIENSGIPFISGTFTNVPNGSTVNLTYNNTTYPFVAWYYGGDGNDLVLLWPKTGLASWGSNASGQLADTTHDPRSNPIAVDQSGVLSGKVIVKLASGLDHTLALTSDGQVYAWGSNAYGQLGDGTTSSRRTPVAVNTASGSSALFGKFAVAIAAGHRHSLVLCSDGTLVSWGENSYGTVGDGSNAIQRNLPVAVDTAAGTSALFGKSVTAISAGYQVSLALCSDGTVASWGNNFHRVLGNDNPNSQKSPVAVNTSYGDSVLFGRAVVAISVGFTHALALCSDGLVAAWGSNNNGVLGDGSTTHSFLPIAVDTTVGSSALASKSVVAISAGWAHSTALCSDGSIAAWGWNYYGQLGDGSNTLRTRPVTVTTAGGSALFGKTVTAIATGGNHSLALCSDGSVAAWGDNLFGQLGDGSTTKRNTPRAVSTAFGTSVLAGHRSSALASGSGSHSVTIYAEPSFPVIQLEALEPVATTLVSGISSIDFGTAYPGASVRTFRVSNSNPGSIPLQGLNISYSGSDAGAFIFLDPLPASIPNGSSSVVRVALTGAESGIKNATLHLTSNDGVATPFTIQLAGIVQTNVSTTMTSPTNGGLIMAAPDLSSSSLHLTLGFAPAPGTALTVIHNNSSEFISKPFENIPNGSIVNLTYDGVTYAFLVWYYGGDGNDLVFLWPTIGLASWGSNSAGQLGDNTSINRSVPSAVDQSGVLGGKTIIQMSRSLTRTLALTHEGQVYEWVNQGSPSTPTIIETTPIPISPFGSSNALTGKFVVAISAGYHHSLALCSDGSVVSWGSNTYGQLGDGSTTDRSSPVAVSSTTPSSLFGKHVVAISAGRYHSLALCSDGTLVSWGYNVWGQLGDGTTFSRSIPVEVNAASGSSVLFGKSVVAVTAGQHHTLALCSDGTVASWGNNFSRQLGDGTNTSSRTSPVAVSTGASSALAGKSVISISAGDSHSLALCAGGSVVAWGENGNGQLGDNSSTDRAHPVAVNTTNSSSALFGKSVAAIATGHSHSIALCSDGSVVTWGLNTSGQLGDNSVTNRPIPVVVNTDSSVSILAGRTVTALASGTGYHSFALYALPSPTVMANATTNITTTNATLTTIINPNGTATTAYLEYGMSSLYGTTVSIPLSPSNGLSAQTVSVTLSDLTPDTTYHFRTVSSIFGGTIYGDDQTFQTKPNPPLTVWKQTEFGAHATTPSIAGDSADPDGDGIPNLIEYATRTNPNAAGASPFAAPSAVLVQPGDVPARLFTFAYRTDAIDVSYIVQRSPDLSAWTAIYRYDPATGQSIEFGDVIGDADPTTQSITITDPATDTKLFWRLSIELAP